MCRADRRPCPRTARTCPSPAPCRHDPALRRQRPWVKLGWSFNGPEVIASADRPELGPAGPPASPVSRITPIEPVMRRCCGRRCARPAWLIMKPADAAVPPITATSGLLRRDLGHGIVHRSRRRRRCRRGCRCARITAPRSDPWPGARTASRRRWFWVMMPLTSRSRSCRSRAVRPWLIARQRACRSPMANSRQARRRFSNGGE